MKRREFLKQTTKLAASSLILSPSLSFAQKIIQNEIIKIQNEEINQSTRNFVQINLYGAPSRWGFDSILKPYDDCEFIENKFLGNKLIQSPEDPLNIKFKYETTRHHGINVPWAWDQVLEIADQQKIPMSALLQNSLIIRGSVLSIEGHPMNGMQQVSPVEGGLSIHGRIADSSQLLFPAISFGNNPVTRSYKSQFAPVTEVPITEKSYLEYLLNPFFIKDINTTLNLKMIEESFDELTKNYTNNTKQLADLKKIVLKNIRSNIDQFQIEYSSLVTKYTTLLNNAYRNSDLNPLISSPQIPFEFKGRKNLNDTLGLFSVENHYYCENDLNLLIKKGDINFWAQEFAITEFLLKNKLCNSILLSPEREIGNLFERCQSLQAYFKTDLDIIYNKTTNTSRIELKKGRSVLNKYLTLPMDSHQTGLVFEVLSTSLFFRALSTGLLELIESLKKIKTSNSTLFDETVIQVASEFDRVPDINGAGSAHYILSNPTIIFSGAIKKPILIGNIFTGAKSVKENQYYGTIGTGAPIDELKTPISISHVSSTISTLLRSDPIVKRAPSLIKEQGDTFISKVEKAKNIRGPD